MEDLNGNNVRLSSFVCAFYGHQSSSWIKMPLIIYKLFSLHLLLLHSLYLDWSTHIPGLWRLRCAISILGSLQWFWHRHIGCRKRVFIHNVFLECKLISEKRVLKQVCKKHSANVILTQNRKHFWINMVFILICTRLSTVQTVERYVFVAKMKRYVIYKVMKQLFEQWRQWVNNVCSVWLLQCSKEANWRARGHTVWRQIHWNFVCYFGFCFLPAKMLIIPPLFGIPRNLQRCHWNETASQAHSSESGWKMLKFGRNKKKYKHNGRTNIWL